MTTAKVTASPAKAAAGGRRAMIEPLPYARCVLQRS
ncbi:hypothetical protein Ae168Ps1_0463c [Pseudonocardia sp. Ae168_Ps1]|nr:hypothetical protein Ae168Ps1_0463c [Pseudonocardia sp. Ae168_Ps1]